MTNNINVPCPHCKSLELVQIAHDDPLNFGTVYKYQCLHCGKIMDAEELSSYSNSDTATSSADKYCYNCNTKMEPFGDNTWWECPNCHYGYMDYIGDLPKEIQLTEEERQKAKQLWESPQSLYFIRDNDESGFAIGSLENLKNTIQFDRCERIIFRDKTLDFIFEIPEERYKDIDTIIVNGHKFVKEKVD